MIRKIIKIDEERCNGCGLCAAACQEGAIAMVNGKARLVRDDYCDGLGNCLPACPTGAISFEEREAAPFDEEAVKAHMAAMKTEKPAACPGSAEKQLFPGCPGKMARSLQPVPAAAPAAPAASQLRQWPVQLKLAPVNAAFFKGASILLAADCAAYAHGDFHRSFMAGKVTLIGCPKLDGVDYSEKLTAILRENEVKSLTVVRMEVPCCGGIEAAARKALQASGKLIPWRVVTLTTDGRVLEDL